MSTPETNVNGNVESTGKPPVAPIEPAFSPETPPRKRGRPSNAEKAARDGQAKIDAANPTKQADARTKAKAAKAGKVYVEPNMEKLAKQVMGVHAIAAKITGMSFLALSELEGYSLAESVVGMAREYDLVVSGKTSATLQLLATAAMIYGPRLVYFAELKKQAKQNGLGNGSSVSEDNAG